MASDEFDAVECWKPGHRYELVHGVLIVSPPPEAVVRRTNDELGYWLRRDRGSRLQGAVPFETIYGQTIATRTSRRYVDRVIWIGAGRPLDYDRDLPDIAIEFVARRSRDRKRDYIDKRREYAEVGVREYWIVDRFRRAMTVFRGADEERVVREGEVYTTDLLPGFELPLARLLSIADRCTMRRPKA